MTDSERLTILINNWANHNTAAQFRNELVLWAKEKGFDKYHVGEFVMSVFTGLPVSYRPLQHVESIKDVHRAIDVRGRGWVHALANDMVSQRFFGEDMDKPENARKYIILAADNPNVEDELPEEGWRFWRAAEFQFRMWKAERRLGLTV